MIDNARGFTLMEVIIVIIILGIVFAAGGTLLAEGFKAYQTQKEFNKISMQGDMALQRMSQEIKSAVTFNTTSANSLSFNKRVNGASETVIFSKSGANVMRGSRVLVGHVNALSFTYLTKTMVATNSATQAYYVTINLTLARSGGGNLTLRTTVFPENAS